MRKENKMTSNLCNNEIISPSPVGEGRGGVCYCIMASAFLIVSGVGFGIAGFCVPPVGSISESVLFLTAQCFVMGGSFVGLDAIFLQRISQLKNHETREKGKDAPHLEESV